MRIACHKLVKPAPLSTVTSSLSTTAASLSSLLAPLLLSSVRIALASLGVSLTLQVKLPGRLTLLLIEPAVSIRIELLNDPLRVSRWALVVLTLLLLGPGPKGQE